MARRKHKKKVRVTSSSVLWPNLGALAIVFGLLVAIAITLMAISRPTPIPSRAASCNDNNCQNVQNGAFWMITNCQSDDPDGDQQLCNVKGRIGQCRGRDYCCPGSKQRWTTDMTDCQTPTPSPAPTNSPVPTNSPTNTPTKTPTPTRRVVTATPRPTSVRVTSTVTPTPTVYVLNYCNKSCGTDADCPGGLVCTGGVLGLGKTCRNSYCKELISCICGDGTIGDQLSVVPTVNELNPIGAGRQIVLTVASVGDKNGNASDRPVFSGITEPGALVKISIFPDGVVGEVTADSTGKWSWRPDKALSPGKKDVVVVSKKDDGQGQVTQSFTVVAGPKINWFSIILVLMVIVAIGFGAYVYYKSL